jgi:hypothetical protein
MCLVLIVCGLLLNVCRIFMTVLVCFQVLLVRMKELLSRLPPYSLLLKDNFYVVMDLTGLIGSLYSMDETVHGCSW